MKTLKTILFATLQILIINQVLGQNFTSRATINQDFCGKSVLVTMKKGVDGMSVFNATHERTAGRGHTTEPIANFLMAYVRDLTYIPRNAGGPAPRLLNEETFMQIVLLRLQDYGKQNVLDVIEQLRFVDGVHYAEPNFFVRTRATIIPNDTRFFELWGLTNIQAPQAWAITTGSHDVRVGVIDMGFGAHDDLNANFDFTYAWCFFSNQAFTQENIGTTIPPHATGVSVGWHGNHVAGTIGAVGNNSLGVTGVNWNVSLVPLDVFTRFHHFGIFGGLQPVASTERQTDAVTHAIIHNIPILNMSMSGFEDNYTFMNHIRNNFNGLFVWAAGNSRSNVDNIFAQSTVPDNTLGVGALYSINLRASFSCFGARTVEIWAPGTDVLSTTLNNAFQTANGTSMASPHVAGVAALLLAKNPNLTGAQLKELLLEGALPITIQPPSGASHQSRRLNALGALDLLDIVELAKTPYTEGFESAIRTATALPHTGWTHSENITAWRTVGNTIDGIEVTQEPRTGNHQLAKSFTQSGHYVWAFSQPIQLYEGIRYTVSFWYRAPGRQSPTEPDQTEYDNFKAQIGPSTTLVGRGGANVVMQEATTIISHTNQQTQDWTEATIELIPTTSGPHFIGFHDMTSADRPGKFIVIDDISITVTPIFDIALNQTEAYTFTEVVAGYDETELTPLNVIIENIGNQPTGELNIALSGENYSSFTLSRATIHDLEVGAIDSFTVVPNIGLEADIYFATVTISGENDILQYFDISFTVSQLTSVAVETQSRVSIHVFPNPVTHELRVVVPSEARDMFVNKSVELFDMLGRRVFYIPVIRHLPNTGLTIDMSPFPSGIYTLRIGEQLVRIVKQ